MTWQEQSEACFPNRAQKDILTRKQISDARKQGVLAMEISSEQQGPPCGASSHGDGGVGWWQGAIST